MPYAGADSSFFLQFLVASVVNLVFLPQYPGWTLTPEGSLLMARVNDDTAGVYMCTPYNSYGSMGPSGPTKIILQVSLLPRCLVKKPLCTQNGVIIYTLFTFVGSSLDA